jgi:hypothetical protein
MGDGEGEADRHGCVDRVSTGFEDCDADIGGMRLDRRYHGVPRVDRAAGAECFAGRQGERRD